MPAAKPEGYVLGRISSDLELYIVESFAQFERMSDLTTGALADVLNGGENDEAIQNLIDLMNRNADLVQSYAKLLHIVTLLARKDFAGAELAAMKLVSGRSED